MCLRPARPWGLLSTGGLVLPTITPCPIADLGDVGGGISVLFIRSKPVGDYLLKTQDSFR